MDEDYLSLLKLNYNLVHELAALKEDRYILFGGNDYYPAGGAEDIIATFSSPEYCDAWIARQKQPRNKKLFTIIDQDHPWFRATVEWWHLWDSHEKTIVKES